MTQQTEQHPDLTFDPRNANKGTSRGRALLEKSLQNYGAGRSILADKNGVIIAGNKTLETASRLGLPVRVVTSDGSELVVVQRTDLDLTTDKTARELAIADNRVAQLDLDWDVEVLAEEQAAGMNLETFWLPEELDELLQDALNRGTEEDEGLERIAPDEETTTPGQYLHFGKLKIPLTEEEAHLLTSRLEAYREECGTYYGFVGRWLDSAEEDEENV